jgi:hypothetical protein
MIPTVVGYVVKALPLKVWVAMLVTAGVIGASWWGYDRVSEYFTARDRTQFEAGRLAERRGNPVDSIFRANLAKQQHQAEQRTDTARRVAQVARTQLEHAIDELPPTVAALPEVRLVVSTATTVVRTATAKETALEHELMLARIRAAADSSQLVDQRVVIALSQDSLRAALREVDRRITKRDATLGGVVIAILSFLIGSAQ